FILNLEETQISHHTGSVADQGHFEVQYERANVHVARTDHGDVIVDGDVLGVQQNWYFVPVDLHSGFEHFFIVRTLGMAHQELVAGLRIDHRHVHSSLGCAGEGGHQGNIGHEVGIGNDQFVLCCMDEGREQLQVILILEAGTAGHYLAKHITSSLQIDGDLRGCVTGQEDAAFTVPIGGEGGFQLSNYRSTDARH